MVKIYTQLAAIQSELKAPKSQINKFGGYMYRKAEDILEAVKPLLKKYGCDLTCTDELLLIGERYYIKATATLTSIEDGSNFSTTAYAREEEEKKGMDGSQVTGASSSYARKYALNGLLCIDDTNDSDTTNVGDQKAAGQQPAGTQRRTNRTVKTQATEQPAASIQLTQSQLAGMVKAQAEGRLSKSGIPYRDAYIQMVHPTEDQLADFDVAVTNYRIENNLPATQ